MIYIILYNNVTELLPTGQSEYSLKLCLISLKCQYGDMSQNKSKHIFGKVSVVSNIGQHLPLICNLIVWIYISYVFLKNTK